MRQIIRDTDFTNVMQRLITYFFLILERLLLLLVFTEAKLIEARLQLSERKQVFKEWHLFFPPIFGV